MGGTQYICVCGAGKAICLGCAQIYDHGGNTSCFRSSCQHMGRKLVCKGCGDSVLPDGGILRAGVPTALVRNVSISAPR